jgi:hypothetical protein
MSCTRSSSSSSSAPGAVHQAREAFPGCSKVLSPDIGMPFPGSSSPLTSGGAPHPGLRGWGTPSWGPTALKRVFSFSGSSTIGPSSMTASPGPPRAGSGTSLPCRRSPEGPGSDAEVAEPIDRTTPPRESQDLNRRLASSPERGPGLPRVQRGPPRSWWTSVLWQEGPRGGLQFQVGRHPAR